MMILEECIEYFEIEAKMSNSLMIPYESRKKYSDDCKQMAEWLRELKKLREIPDKLIPKYRDGIQDEYDRGANEMLEEVINDIRKYIAEVNADV